MHLLLRSLHEQRNNGTQETYMDLLHVLGIIALVLESICAVMGIVYYALKFSDRKQEARKRQAE